VVAELARRYPNAASCFGRQRRADLRRGAEAAFALRVLESFGIARTRITLEDRSRNTVENASFHGHRPAKPASAGCW